MTGIILELQKEALDKRTQISDLLRKALLVAKKLKVQEIESWIMCELNGYSNNNEIPEYRHLSGEMKAHNPYNGHWMPIMFPEKMSALHQNLIKQTCGQSVAEVETLIKECQEDGGELILQYPPKTQAQLIKAASLSSPPVLFVSSARLPSILDTVRTRILEWALQLEEQGIIGENLSFSTAEKEAASNVNIHIGTMNHSQIQANAKNSSQSIQAIQIDPKALKGFIKNLEDAIPQLSLDTQSSSELKSELATIKAQAESPKPKQGILKETIQSIKTILEGTAAGVLTEGLIRSADVLLG